MQAQGFGLFPITLRPKPKPNQLNISMKAITTILSVLALASFTLNAAEGDAPKKPKMSPEDAFKKLDKDSNGAVSKEEFLASPQAKKDAAKAEKMFTAKDKDANGSLSLDEYKAGGKKKEAK